MNLQPDFACAIIPQKRTPIPLKSEWGCEAKLCQAGEENLIVPHTMLLHHWTLALDSSSAIEEQFYRT
jgi:hypothetical protein